MEIKNIIPWRIRNFVHQVMENSLRPAYPSLYKLIKFGRTNINTPEYWDKTWKNDKEERQNSELFEFILRRVTEGDNILDVGCGGGNLTRFLTGCLQVKITCLDFSAYACEQLSNDGFDTVVSQLPTIPLSDDIFDIAIATEVFEHLSNPMATLEQMKRVVRPGGLVIFSVPNDALHPHEELEHQHTYTKNKIEKMLSKYFEQFEIEVGVLNEKHQFLLSVAKV